MKNLILVLMPLAAGLMQACSSSEGKENQSIPAADTVPVQVMTLEKKNVQTDIQASGQFSTDDETYLSFKTTGVIDKIWVNEGDAITTGQLLATLNLTEINAAVTQAQAAFEKAKRDFERVTNLYRDSVATLEQYQNAKTGFDIATQQYEAAKFNRSFSEIRALSNGYVLRKMANAGQVIQSGTPVFQTNGARKGIWKLKTGVSDKAWASISLSDKAVITTDAVPGENFSAFVSRKSEGTDPLTGSFAIELTLTGKLPSSIASGMFGKATLTPSRSQHVWAIPYDALLDGDAQSGYVFVTDDLQTAHKVPVVVSAIDHDQILVSAGLENAKALITSGSAYLRDGSPIRVTEKK